MADTIISQGKFVATGDNVTIKIRTGFDWLRIYNATAAFDVADDLGYEFYYQTGMNAGSVISWAKINTDVGSAFAYTTIFEGVDAITLVDTSGNPLSAREEITAGTDNVNPVYDTANTGTLIDGDIVRLSSMAGNANLSGYDVQVTNVVANTSFEVAVPLATAPNDAAVSGFWRKVNFDPMYYPRHRYIVNIVPDGNESLISFSVPSGYQAGQKIRILVPSVYYGMIEINNMIGTILTVDDTIGNCVVAVDIDSSSFTPFTFPTNDNVAFDPISKAMAVPIGEDTARALALSTNILSDATDNRGYIGVRLIAGDFGPAGQNGDDIYWSAGVSTVVDTDESLIV